MVKQWKILENIYISEKYIDKFKLYIGKKK